MTTPGDFDVRVDETPAGAVVVHVSGDLDLATAGDLEAALRDLPPGSRVVIDLGACTFLDSSGVRVLAVAARERDEAGDRLDVVVADPGIARILEITSIDTLIEIHPSVEAAL